MSIIMHDNTGGTCRQSRHTRVHRAGSRQAAIACPSWCATNHDIDPDGGHDGPSWPDIPSVSDNRAEVVFIAAGHQDKHGVIVYLDAERSP
jgi:hypothetical protein